MNNIYLEETDNSPKVIMDKDKAYIEFDGRSFPENTFAFYRPITEWLKQYFKLYVDDEKTTIIKFKFLYFNSATTQIIFEILDIVQDAGKKNLDISWYYEKESELGYEDYEDYSEEFPELHIKSVEY